MSIGIMKQAGVAYSCDNSIVCVFLSFRKFPYTTEQVEEQIHRVKEAPNALPQFVINFGGLEKESELLNEECPRHLIALAIRHEQRIKLCDDLVLNVIKVAFVLVLRHDHMGKYRDGIASQLVVVTEAEIEDLTNQREKIELIPSVWARLVRWVVLERLPQIQQNRRSFSTEISC